MTMIFPKRQGSRWEKARERLREKGYSESEIDEMESEAAEREYDRRKEDGEF